MLPHHDVLVAARDSKQLLAANPDIPIDQGIKNCCGEATPASGRENRGLKVLIWP